jgi:hypothetical protein
VPPYASYLFKHALVQDAAYGTLLREPRRSLHARIAETIEGRFPEIAESQPELLARHCTEAGLIEKGARLLAKLVCGRRNGQLWLKPSDNSHAPSSRSRVCPPPPHCAASKLSFRSGLPMFEKSVMFRQSARQMCWKANNGVPSRADAVQRFSDSRQTAGRFKPTRRRGGR